VAQLKSLNRLRRTLYGLAVVINFCILATSSEAGRKTIDAESLKVLGFVLGKDEVEDVEAKLGKARASHGPDHDMTQRCYQSKNADHTVLAFEDWSGTLSGFRIYRSARSNTVCTATAAVTPEIATASGLKLGLSRDDVLRILGQPTEASANRLVYKSESKRPMTEEEVSRYRQAYPGEATSDFTVFVTTEIKLSFRNLKLFSINVSHTKTT
jgi:hypothetical protein